MSNPFMLRGLEDWGGDIKLMSHQMALLVEIIALLLITSSL